MNYLEKLENKEDKTITSLELLDLINIFRQREYEFKKQNKTLTKSEELKGSCIELRHDTLLDIIRDEFEEEISLQKILGSTYTNSRGRKYLLFILEIEQAMQILSRESKFVRKAVIQKLKEL